MARRRSPRSSLGFRLRAQSLGFRKRAPAMLCDSQRPSVPRCPAHLSSAKRCRVGTESVPKHSRLLEAQEALGDSQPRRTAEGQGQRLLALRRVAFAWLTSLVRQVAMRFWRSWTKIPSSHTRIRTACWSFQAPDLREDKVKYYHEQLFRSHQMLLMDGRVWRALATLRICNGR